MKRLSSFIYKVRKYSKVSEGDRKSPKASKGKRFSSKKLEFNWSDLESKISI